MVLRKNCRAQRLKIVIEGREGKNKGGHKINSLSTPFKQDNYEEYQTFILILLYQEFRT